MIWMSEGDLRMNVEKWKSRATRVERSKIAVLVGYILFSRFLVLYTKTANLATPRKSLPNEDTGINYSTSTVYYTVPVCSLESNLTA